MKPRLAFSLLSVLAWPALSHAQSAPAPAREPAPAPASSTPPPAPPATAADPVRFSSFEGASPAVVSAVANAQAVAAIVRERPLSTTISVDPVLSRAVAQASAAIVQDGRVARTSILAERQSTLTRLRLAQTEAERRRLIDDLRVQSGLRMERQREVARLVRDRLRELRSLTTINRPAGN